MGSDPGKVVSGPTEAAETTGAAGNTGAEGTTGVTKAKEAARDKKTTKDIPKLSKHVLESPDVDVFSIKAFERYAKFKTIGKK